MRKGFRRLAAGTAREAVERVQARGLGCHHGPVRLPISGDDLAMALAENVEATSMVEI